MRIHKEGYLIILISFLVLGFLVPLLGLISMPAWVQYTSWAILFLTFAWVVRFFRYPKRGMTVDHLTIMCPADGKVVAVEEVFEPEYFKDKRIQVSVFMSPNNVHVNWSPVSGAFSYVKYHAGKYLVAWHPKSSTENERTSMVIDTESGIQVLVRQIAGAMARRIVCYGHEGNPIRQGDQIGFIKFGSRVDVFLPLGSDIKVKIGDKVKGKVNILAEIDA